MTGGQTQIVRQFFVDAGMTESKKVEILENGRGGEIRTHDLLYPKQAR